MKHYCTLLLLAAAIAAAGCKETIDGISLDEAIMLNGPATTDSLPADGVSTVTLIAHLGTDVAPNKPITFRTNWGSFTGIPDSGKGSSQTLTVNATGREALVHLRAGILPIDAATVTATVGGDGNGYTDTLTLPVRTVYPDSLLIETARVHLDTNETDTLHLTVRLFRAQHGYATDSLPVRFYVIPDSAAGTRVTVVPQRAISSNGTATAVVRSASRKAGTVTVIAQTRLSWTTIGSDAVRIVVR